MNVKIIVAAAIALVAAGAAYWLFRSPDTAPDVGATPPPLAAPANPVPPPTVAAPPPEKYPIDSGPTAAALPTLENSDPVLTTVVTNLIGRPAFTRWLRQDQLVRRIVTTVDALGKDTPAFEQRLLRYVGGAFLIEGDELRATIVPANAARYVPLMNLLTATDLHALVREYRRLYPLLQSTYQAMDHPTGRFNDRLVEVIDLMLATPDVAQPIELQRPGVMYVYADPKLEGLSSGQKILLRVGHEQAAVVKQRMRELRALVTAPGSSTPSGSTTR